ncbi:hypothetical protein M0804_006884 [Polistes exclamans]|nr:hypothetical protein M0804_006884 [Polistes exclamans]
MRKQEKSSPTQMNNPSECCGALRIEGAYASLCITRYVILPVLEQYTFLHMLGTLKSGASARKSGERR